MNEYIVAKYTEHNDLAEVNQRPVNNGKLDEFTKRVKHL